MDIDAYAGCIGYAALLNLMDIQAKAVSTAPLNNSITKSIKNLNKGLDSYTPRINDKFVLIDISNHEYIDAFVVLDRVIEVIDHHTGHEDYWRNRIGHNSLIEKIGSSCTQVFERWQQAGHADEIPAEIATLLMAGILDNTLNFKAGVTTQRDVLAYEALKHLSTADERWPAMYFTECQQAITHDLGQSIRDDAKFMEASEHLPSVMAQLVLWDGETIIANRRDEVFDAMRHMASDWLLNVVSISGNRSYLLSDNAKTQRAFATLLGGTFQANVMAYEHLLLRKEIMRLHQEAMRAL